MVASGKSLMASADAHYPMLPGAALWRGQRIGLLGGSFNPAHDGHRYISVTALKRLGLDHVWWLVSPLNPLKSKEGMAPFAERVAMAKKVARHPRIHVSTIENRLHTRFTVDTLERLQKLAPATQFVWLMGADNLAQFPLWHRWEDIMRTVPLAIFDRDHYSLRGMAGKMAYRFRHSRMSVGAAKAIATEKPPAWIFITLRRHPLSATKIRNEPTMADSGLRNATTKE